MKRDKQRADSYRQKHTMSSFDNYYDTLEDSMNIKKCDTTEGNNMADSGICTDMNGDLYDTISPVKVSRLEEDKRKLEELWRS